MGATYRSNSPPIDISPQRLLGVLFTGASQQNLLAKSCSYLTIQLVLVSVDLQSLEQVLECSIGVVFLTDLRVTSQTIPAVERLVFPHYSATAGKKGGSQGVGDRIRVPAATGSKPRRLPPAPE